MTDSQDKARYKNRMQRKKEHIDAKIEEATIDRGIIVLLTGNGKGKSSSALGMVCRTLAYGKQVAVAKFLKGEQETGEDNWLQAQTNVQTVYMKTGFTWNTQDKQYDTEKAQATWQVAEQYLNDESIDLVVLDELTYMISYTYLDESEIITALQNRPTNQHVVITGRAASKGLIDIADTVSEVKDVKHAFRAKVKAQQGIDL